MPEQPLRGLAVQELEVQALGRRAPQDARIEQKLLDRTTVL